MEVKITIPHFCTFVPHNFLYQYKMSPDEMNRHIDFGTEKIFELEKYSVLKATASRFVADLNRERTDTKSDQGVIINKAWDGKQVLKKELSAEEIEQRLILYYDPFFKQLNAWLTKKIFLLDGHSMDSTPGITPKNPGEKRPDICIATDLGKTCSPEIIEIFMKEFEKNGFSVEKDKPYSGSRAKIIHLAKELGSNAMELEINKKTYMNEKTLEINNEKIRKLRQIISDCLLKVEKLE